MFSLHDLNFGIFLLPVFARFGMSTQEPSIPLWSLQPVHRTILAYPVVLKGLLPNE